MRLVGRVSRSIPVGFGLTGGLFWLMALVGAPTSAAFSNAPADSGQADAFVRTLCEGDCEALGHPPEIPGSPGSQIDFDFGLGLQAVGDGLSIDLFAAGDIYVMGPVRVVGDIYVLAPVRAGGDVVLTARGDLELISEIGNGVGGGGPVEIGSGGGVVLSGGGGGEVGIESGGELVLSAGGGGLTSGGPGGRPSVPGILEPLGGGGPTPPGVSALESRVLAAATMGEAGSTLFYRFDASGDVYLDISQAFLNSLRLETLGSLLFTDLPLKPPVVPEPGTGLLLALGLLGLGSRRAHLIR
jgi:hypothetical protein